MRERDREPEQVAVRVERVARRVDHFLPEQGHELTGPDVQAVADREEDVDVELRRVELVLRAVPDAVVIEDAVGVDQASIRAPHHFDVTAELEFLLLEVDRLVDVDDKLVERRIFVLEVEDAAGVDLGIAEVVRYAPFDVPTDHQAEIVHGLADAELVGDAHQARVGRTGVRQQSRLIQGQSRSGRCVGSLRLRRPHQTRTRE